MCAFMHVLLQTLTKAGFWTEDQLYSPELVLVHLLLLRRTFLVRPSVVSCVGYSQLSIICDNALLTQDRWEDPAAEYALPRDAGKAGILALET